MSKRRSTHRILDCNKFKSEVAPPWQLVLQCGQRLGPVRALLVVATVMQTKHFSITRAPLQTASGSIEDVLNLPDQPFRSGCLPVSRELGLQNPTHIQLPRFGCQPRITESPRWP